MLKMRSAQMSARDVTGGFCERSCFLFHGCNFVFKFLRFALFVENHPPVQTFRINFKHSMFLLL